MTCNIGGSSGDESLRGLQHFFEFLEIKKSKETKHKKPPQNNPPKREEKERKTRDRVVCLFSISQVMK